MKRIYALFFSVLVLGLTTVSADAQDRYRLQSGDTLRIEVLEDSSLNQEALVRPDGNISVPFAGSIPAGGRTVAQVEADITGRLAPNFASEPNVFVTLSALNVPREPLPPRLIDVYVVGEAEEPGKFEVAPGTTLLQLFAEMGGFSRFAATKRIYLRRMDKTGREHAYKFNYDAIVRGTGTGATTRLVDGDVIVIPQRKLFE